VIPSIYFFKNRQKKQGCQKEKRAKNTSDPRRVCTVPRTVFEPYSRRANLEHLLANRWLFLEGSLSYNHIIKARTETQFEAKTESAARTQMARAETEQNAGKGTDRRM
jgi:hypothetical protein